jgi:putative redox protein
MPPQSLPEGTVMQVDVRQLDNVKFSIHARQHAVICDQPTENGGFDEGMTPPELLLASLGSCAAFYAVEYLRTRNLSSDPVEVSVYAEKLKNPSRLGHFQIEVRCSGGLTNEQQQGMLRSVHACLIHNTLMSVPDIEIVVKTPELVA